MRYVILVFALILFISAIINYSRPKEDRDLGATLIMVWIGFVVVGLFGAFIKLTIQYW